MILTISDDFDPDKIADSGQCFRREKVEPRTYRVISGAGCLYLSALGENRFELDCSEEDFTGFWRNYLDLDEDYARIRARIDPASDPFLSLAAEREKGIRILRQDPWEMLVTFIISQNRNIPAIRCSVELLAERCGEGRIDSRGQPYFAFPGPSAVATLSGEALSRCRLGYPFDAYSPYNGIYQQYIFAWVRHRGEQNEPQT